MSRRRARALLLAAPLAALAACKEESPRADAAPPTPSRAADPRLEQARAAVADPLRQRLRASGEVAQRGVQAFAQALPGQFAVCGRVAEQGPLVPYVALVVFEHNTPRVAELALGATAAEAGRVFAEMVERCFDGGGPLTARASARPMPVLPAPEAPPPAAATSGARASAGGGAALVTEVAARAPELPQVATPTGRTVTTASGRGANIRAAPGGGGEVLRVAPRAATLEVYGEAPGGWFQVGQNGQVWGWVHASVLER